jgi:hypothetical protein
VSYRRVTGFDVAEHYGSLTDNRNCAHGVSGHEAVLFPLWAHGGGDGLGRQAVLGGKTMGESE